MPTPKTTATDFQSNPNSQDRVNTATTAVTPMTATNANADDRRPAWQRGLAALAWFVLAAAVLVPAWWVVMIVVAYSWTDAVFPGMGSGGSRPTSWWFSPLSWSSLAAVVVIIFRITWKVWRHRA